MTTFLYYSFILIGSLLLVLILIKNYQRNNLISAKTKAINFNKIASKQLGNQLQCHMFEDGEHQYTVLQTSTGPLLLSKEKLPPFAKDSVSPTGSTPSDNSFVSKLVKAIQGSSAVVLLGALMLFSDPASAQGIGSVVSEPLANGGEQWSLSLETLLLLTSLTFIPALLLMTTAFTRIIIVLSLLRTAMGTQSVPPNQVILGLALFLTFFVMSPVWSKVYDQAWLPYSEEKINVTQFFDKAQGPVREFMIGQTREADIARFAEIANVGEMDGPEDVPLRVLLPAFALSEIKTAFQIGFTIFIPFLIIDLLVASILMALGMMMVPPATISLPFKLMLFILADGWNLLMGSLASSFYIL